MPHVLVWDIETIPDISGYAAANNLFDKTAEEVRAAMGDKFPKHIYHSISAKSRWLLNGMVKDVRSELTEFERKKFGWI